MNKAFRGFVSGKRIWIVVLATCSLIATTLIWEMHTDRLLSVQTNSMSPVLVRGDAVVITPTQLKSLKLGDMVSYRSATNPNVLVTHRIIYINVPQQAIVTKGDNAGRSDGTITSQQIIGRVSYTIDRLGYVLNFVRSRTGLFCLIYMPALLILVDELQRLFKKYSVPTYQLPRKAPKSVVLR